MGTGSLPVSWMSSRAAPYEVRAEFDFGASARYSAASVSGSTASGMPTKWAACWAAIATWQRLRVGEADVLRRRDDQAPRDEHDVLAGLEHARHPVDGGVGVAAAHALDERRDDVVVLVARRS